MEGARRLHGENDDRTFYLRIRCTDCLMDIGDYEKALCEWEHLLHDSRQARGEDHPETLKLWNDYAWALFASEKIAEAHLEYEFLIPECVRILGEHDPQTVAYQELSQKVAEYFCQG